MIAARTPLSSAALSSLQDLIRANIDSRDAFQEAAANVPSDSSLANVFSRLARQRGTHVDELQDLVACYDELPEHTGTLGAAAHRMWMDLRAAWGGGPAAILAEAERGEGTLVRRYQQAIDALSDADCLDTLRRQFAAVKMSQDRIHAMREEHREGVGA